jgi:hypothetical protein
MLKALAGSTLPRPVVLLCMAADPGLGLCPAAPPVASTSAPADPFGSLGGASGPAVAVAPAVNAAAAAAAAAASVGLSPAELAQLPPLLATPGGVSVAGRVLRSAGQISYLLLLKNEAVRRAGRGP